MGRVLIREGSQYLGKNYSIGFFGAQVDIHADEFPLQAKIGVACDGHRSIVTLSRGESAELSAVARITVAEIFVDPDGAEAALVLEISDLR